jgi:metallophosphoesterase (TIGR03767 family)
MLRRTLACSISLALVAGGALLTGGTSSAQIHTPEPCGLTTLDATLRIGEESGLLECGPGEPLVVREDLADRGSTANRTPLTAFFSIADVQLADEESPARGEWADKCEQHPASAAFRPHETMVPHLMNAHVRAANLIAERGSPVLGASFDFVVGLGDLADNQQFNEIRWIIDIFDGHKLVDPDSGADGYDGVQGADPRGAKGEALTPVEGQSVLDLANEPFWAEGLSLRWYSLPGNHDVKTQGTISDDNPAWRAFVRRHAVGTLKVMDLAPDYQQRLCEDPSLLGDPAFWQQVLANPGTTKIVPADPKRMPLYRSPQARTQQDLDVCLNLTGNEHCRTTWVEEHFHTTGKPEGHGYGDKRCKDDAGNLLPRACYSFTRGQFHYIALDSNPPEGLESGNIDPAQFAWLEKELTAYSSTCYDEQGKEVCKPAKDKLIVIFSHHPFESMDNTGIPPGSSSGKTAEELRDLLLRFPNVILMADGHTHKNKIWPWPSERDTGFWEVNTSAIADYPHQSRTIEIADNGNGTLSIFAVVFDAATPPDARAIDWTMDDRTNEKAKGAKRRINEDWLASWGREVGFYDPQADLTKIGEPEDRNVELLLPAPTWFTQAQVKKSRGSTQQR